MYTVENLTDEVSGILQGTDLDNVTDLNGAIERSARILAQEIDVPESFGQKSYMLFDGVYDYLAPDTIFGGAFADLAPQGVSRLPWEGVTKRPIQLFDMTKTFSNYLNCEVTFTWQKGTPIMRVAGSRAQQRLVIDPLSNASDWSPTTIASLFTDTATYWHTPASIRFNLPSTGSITRNLTNSVNMSSYIGVGSVFLAMRMETTDMTGVEIHIGSDSSNYYKLNATQGFLGTWQANNFQLTQFDLSSAVVVGTPNSSAIDYIQILFTATGTMLNVRVGDLFVSMPTAYEMTFYSPAIFLADGELSNTITTNTDIITLGYAAYTIYQYITAETIASQMGGLVSQVVLDRIWKKLRDPMTGLMPMYRADNPSEELRQNGNYYSSPGM